MVISNLGEDRYAKDTAAMVEKQDRRGNRQHRLGGGLEGKAQLLDYAITRGGIHTFTKSPAGQLLPRGIRVNAVALARSEDAVEDASGGAVGGPEEGARDAARRGCQRRGSDRGNDVGLAANRDRHFQRGNGSARRTCSVVKWRTGEDSNSRPPDS